MGKTVVFDFDGVIHSYCSGWNGMEIISDPVVPGIKETIGSPHGNGYNIIVVSTRCPSAEGSKAVEKYLKFSV